MENNSDGCTGHQNPEIDNFLTFIKSPIRLVTGDGKLKPDFDDKEVKEALKLPFAVKLFVPYILHNFPDLILFLRHDSRKLILERYIHHGAGLVIGIVLIYFAKLESLPECGWLARTGLSCSPRLQIVENSPTPFPIVEGYNFEGQRVFEKDVTFCTRKDLNKLMAAYDQLPLGSLESSMPHDFDYMDMVTDMERRITLFGYPM